MEKITRKHVFVHTLYLNSITKFGNLHKNFKQNVSVLIVLTLLWILGYFLLFRQHILSNTLSVDGCTFVTSKSLGGPEKENAENTAQFTVLNVCPYDIQVDTLVMKVSVPSQSEPIQPLTISPFLLRSHESVSSSAAYTVKKEYLDPNVAFDLEFSYTSKQ